MGAIALCMIVRDEAETILRALSSVSGFIDYVCIVDTGSVDDTPEIIKEWCNNNQFPLFMQCKPDLTSGKLLDFSVARNLSFDLGQQLGVDFLFWMDADDVVPEDSARIINERIDDIPDDVDYVLFQYVYAYDEFGKPYTILKRERLLRAASNPKWIYPIHECIEIANLKGISWNDVFIEHRRTPKQAAADSNRNLEIFQKLYNMDPNDPRCLYYYGRELIFAGFIDEGVEKLKKRIELQGFAPELVAANMFIADCCVGRGKIGEAKEYYMRAVLLDHKHARAHCRLGELYAKENNFDAAIFHYENAARIPIPRDDILSVLPQFHGRVPLLALESLYYNVGNKQQSYEICCRLLGEDYFPGNPGLLSDKAMLERELGIESGMGSK